MEVEGKKFLIGVTGSIAAYKTCELVNLLLKNKASVKVVMTEAALKFITPLTFETLTKNPVYTNMFERHAYEVEHIALAQWADCLVITPASANTISKISLGLADNLLTTVVMAVSAKTPVIIAPAMNTSMWQNKIVQNNISKLKESPDKYIIVEPRTGRLACGDVRQGPLAEIETIFAAISKV